MTVRFRSPKKSILRRPRSSSGGWSNSHQFDANGNVTRIVQTGAGGATIGDVSYAYDGSGRLASETSGGSTRSYRYDGYGQLVNVSDGATTSGGTTTAGGGTTSGSGSGSSGSGSSGTSTSDRYIYDSEGNRTGAGYVTGAGNQTLSDGVFNYTYDANGNRTSKSGIATGEAWAYGYDLLNHLTSVEERTSAGALVSRVEYAYDAFGNRLSRTEYDSALNVVGSERYAYDMWKTALDASGSQRAVVGNENADVWADLDGGNNALVARRVFGDGADQLVARVGAGGAVSWYLTDRQGSVVGLTDASGST